MFETFVGFSLKILAGCLAFAGVWLAIEAVIDIHRCRRLIFYHVIYLLCAGSALALGLQHALF